jgi:hypothetical protein
LIGYCPEVTGHSVIGRPHEKANALRRIGEQRFELSLT